jgi:hypothetical protein
MFGWRSRRITRCGGRVSGPFIFSAVAAMVDMRPSGSIKMAAVHLQEAMNSHERARPRDVVVNVGANGAGKAWQPYSSRRA